MQSKSFSQKLITFFGSKLFFGITVVLFLLQASWIALSARYPQAFDEQFHLGIIQLYAHQLSPFFAHQPAGADSFGAVARDPSYLYHYLLSFPYRWVAHFTSDLTIQVIVLRFINIVLLGSALFIFRKLFLRYTSASKSLINLVMFFFVTTPVVPLLASQINYDNLTVPVTGLAVWGTLAFLEQLRVKKVWRWDILALLLITCLLASLIKYAFLPIFVAIVLLVAWAWIYQRKKKQRVQYKLPSKPRIAIYGLVLLASMGLFIQMYGVNMLRYHTPIPECNQVLSVQECKTYAPWARNYSIEEHKISLPVWKIVSYPFIWLYHTMGELTFTIASSFNNSGTVDYYVGTQLILIEVISWAVFGVGVILSIYYARKLWRQKAIRVFVVITALYIAILGGQNLQDYIHLGQPIAIHGRYLLPVLPLIYFIIALAVREFLQNIPRPRMAVINRKLILTLVMMFLMLFEGGGFVTYILRSNPSWFWPQSSPVQKVNSKAKKILKPLVVDTKKK